MEWHEGDVIRKLRDTVHWTLQDLSHRSGVNVQVIHRLEKGITRDATRDTLQRIAAPFGLTAEDIRALVPDPRIPAVVTRVRKQANEPPASRAEKPAPKRRRA